MPKRPCTLALTPDDSTIICGDKFGDVYSLPLLGKIWESRERETSENINENIIEQSKKPFTPTANPRTVHTKKNREALRNQQRQLKQSPEKGVLQFEHQLLLGHVSLLTDLVYVRLGKEESPSGRRRDHIITSDRDEHIRVSRGIPQAYITERYCLGHTQFVSKICVPHRKRQMLVSGGGDDHLFVWDWLSGSVRQKVDIREYVTDLKLSRVTWHSSETKIAVSGMWDISNSEIHTQTVDLIITLEAYVSSSPRNLFGELLTSNVLDYQSFSYLPSMNFPISHCKTQ